METPLSKNPQAILVLQSRFPLAPGVPYIKETYPAIEPAAIYRFDHPQETLPGGGTIPPQPLVPGTAPEPTTGPGASQPKGPDIIMKLCPYFKWVPVGMDCNLQVLAGAAVVILGGALLIKMIKR